LTFLPWFFLRQPTTPPAGLPPSPRSTGHSLIKPGGCLAKCVALPGIYLFPFCLLYSRSRSHHGFLTCATRPLFRNFEVPLPSFRLSGFFFFEIGVSWLQRNLPLTRRTLGKSRKSFCPLGIGTPDGLVFTGVHHLVI